MADTTQDRPANPPVRGGVVAYLQVDGAIKAKDLYEKAFGAETINVIPVDDQGRTMHVHLVINGSSVMLGDFYPEHGHPKTPPQSFSLMLMVPDVDAALQRAADAGIAVTMPAQDMFWGARYAQVTDPFGVMWAFNGPLKGQG